MDNYLPGACNIGPAEIRYRMRYGYVALAIACVLVVALELAGGPRALRFLLVFPLGVAIAGFVQARMRFCLAYGWRGVFSINGRRQLQHVQDREALRADRRTALRIMAIVVTGSVSVTAAFYLLGG